MQEELRLSLLLLGGFFIFGVLAHGIWNIRKNSQAKKPQRRIEPEQWQEDSSAEPANTNRRDDFDEDGIGEVRVIHESASDDDEFDTINADEMAEPADNEEDATSSAAANAPQADSLTDDVQPPAEKLYASVVSNPKPHYQHDNVVELPESVPAPPAFLLKDEAKTENKVAAKAATPAEDDFSLDAQPAPAAEPVVVPDKSAEEPVAAKKRSRSSARRRQEPRFGDDQMQIDFDDSVSAEPASAAGAKVQVEPEVLILNVRAPEDAPISGAALLPMLLTLGFKFGDQDIFHRHVNSNGKGPVLFSLANMFKPGNFDIDNLETFTTRGVSLFMLLPIEGDPHQVFNMMHNAARKIADEFNAQVLDGRRSVLSKQGLQQYVEKIRDFERKRMIARN
ncbi:cell division protein ZipA [Alteromonas lipolytica]|uniref:Cell division protein ZipA n=1 Tax=Alteromonas lipolytica TaxID=1856405 RepID=A0A1E8FGK0_9ALTE|nr:cell division protein ZipA [Alteromonas lipolytica]OFI35061.1 cell division protein ZipA [Alteromonas lipolytica]GGF56303.1 cell division protein ZipA [Alteromonas lipolytica]